MDSVRFKGARHAARIDQHVGDKIRRRRMLLGYTQEQLAESLDISYQQIQKYETGANRVSAGRLYQIAERLEVPITFFFDGLGMEYEPENASGSNRATIELVRHFNQIGDISVRSALTGLVKSLANGASGDTNGEDQSASTAGQNAGRAAHQGRNGSGNGNGADA